MQKSILVKLLAAAFVTTAFSAPAFAADTIKIGVAGPHTGDLAPYGLPSKDASKCWQPSLMPRVALMAKRSN